MNQHTEAPGTPQDSLYHRVDISPDEVFKAIGRLRKAAQDEVDRLLAFLDELDGDTDLEPSLAGYSEGMDDGEGDPGYDDREPDVDDEDGADDEPSLCGITANEIASYGSNDLEDQCEDEGVIDSGIADADGLLEQAPIFAAVGVL